MKFQYKVVTSGDIVEIYEYEKQVETGVKRPGAGRKKESEKDWVREGLKAAGTADKQKNRADVLHRAAKTLRRQINANVGAWEESTKFITLTYADNMTDLKESNYNFKKFIQRLNYKLGIKLKYSCVVEFQKRGAIHYHLVAYNLPYIQNKKLAEIWSYGFVKVNKIDNVTNVGAYVTKYMTKDSNDDRLLGEKCYFSSRDLIKPEEYGFSDKKEMESISGALHSFKTYSAEYETDYLGVVKYQQFNLKSLTNTIITQNDERVAE